MLAGALVLVGVPLAGLGVAPSAPSARALALLCGGGMIVAELLLHRPLGMTIGAYRRTGAASAEAGANSL